MSLQKFRAQRAAKASGQAPPSTSPPKKKPAPVLSGIGTTEPTHPTFFELPYTPMNRPPSPYDPVGILLANEYTVEALLGQGVTAYVFRCTHKATNHSFALKAIDKSCLTLKTDALANEVHILSHVNHPCIVSLVALFEDDDYVYLILPLMKGGELFERIVKTCPNGYTERHAARIMKSILSALEYLHKGGIVHRDLKPENLLFPTENIMSTNVMVSDFGLAKIWTEDTLLKTACGSPNYVAPEVLLKNSVEGYTCAADMWSAGVIAYVILCGFAPFHHEQTPMLLKLIIIGHFTFPSPYWDTISKDAMNFVSRLLVRDPAQRATASEALQHPWIKKHAGTTTTTEGITPMDDGTAAPTELAIPKITETLKLFQQMHLVEGVRRRDEAEQVNTLYKNLQEAQESSGHPQ